MAGGFTGEATENGFSLGTSLRPWQMAVFGKEGGSYGAKQDLCGGEYFFLIYTLWLMLQNDKIS